MRRPAKNHSKKLSADSNRLVSMAQGLVQSSSRVEERSWENHLDTLLCKLLRTNHQDTLDAALDQLFKTDLPAYDALMEAVEACSESRRIEHEGADYDALLIALPILAWTRFSIASGKVTAEALTTIGAHLHAHVLAPDVRLSLAPTLFAIDQLPRSHAETFALTQRMAQAALSGTPIRPPTNAPETAPFLADTRYLLGAIVVPAGEPMFHWQSTMNPNDREQAALSWNEQATPNVARLLPGCSVDLLLPEAYYVACREADKYIRPASIRAAVNFLTHTLGIEPNGLRAVIGSFSEDPLSGRVDEYRIGFTVRQSSDVVYGVVWPLYGQEDEEEASDDTPEVLLHPEEAVASGTQTPLEDILALLRECGIVHIKRHTERFPLEFCEDCGAPLYPDPEAELVHAEMPEDAPAGTGHFH